MFCKRNNKGEREQCEDEIEIIEDRKYKNFAETFKISSFSLAINMMYPKRSVERTRLLVVLAMLSTFLPGLLMLGVELYDSFMIGDLDNITRQITLIIPFSLVAFKMMLANWNRRDFESILSKITSDLLAANDFDEDYRILVDQYIRFGKRGQYVWTVASLMVTGIFTIMAGGLMMWHNLRYNEVKRYMVHDIKIPGLGEKTYDSPFFEIMFAYMMYLSCYFIVNFTGFDGTFCISVNHAALKFKLMTHRLTRAFEDSRNAGQIRHEIKKVIEDHLQIYQYTEQLQSMYGPWLAVVFSLTFVQICLTLYQVSESDSIDPKYLIFVVGSVQHIYMPCHFAAMLKQTADISSSEIYCCGWEKVLDKRLTDAVRFMIARSQIPFQITAMGMVTFDMLLFTSMLQTSYSMFTLLTSR